MLQLPMPEKLNRKPEPCPNPTCDKLVIYARARTIELPPESVQGYDYVKMRKIIGVIYHHEDGTLCDKTLFRIQELREPAWLSLGDHTRDPRN